MEHRCSHRISAEFPIRLHLQNKSVSAGVARNLSRDGVFVDVGRCEVQKNQPLRLELMDGNSLWHSFGTIVTHHGDDGVGLEFVREYAEVDRLLAELATSKKRNDQ